MKLNLFLVSMLATAAFVACSKDADNASSANDGQKKTVTVTVKTDTESRLAQDAFSDAKAAVLTSGTIFFADGASDNSRIVQWKPLDLDNLPQIIHNLQYSATHAILVANYTVTTNPQTIGELMNTAVAFSAENQTLENVPLRSDVTELVENAFTDAEHPDNNQYTVELHVRPMLARIEIGGELKVTTADGESFVYSVLTPEGVGLNGMKTSFLLSGAASGETYLANDNLVGYPVVSTDITIPGTPEWMYDQFAAPVELIGSEENKMNMGVHGFNVVAGDTPTVIIALVGTPIETANPKPAAPRAYLKIINFTADATVKTTLEAGKIYKISGVAFNQSQLIPLDNTGVCVEVAVSVEEWQVMDISPEFGNK